MYPIMPFIVFENAKEHANALALLAKLYEINCDAPLERKIDWLITRFDGVSGLPHNGVYIMSKFFLDAFDEAGVDYKRLDTLHERASHLSEEGRKQYAHLLKYRPQYVV